MELEIRSEIYDVNNLLSDTAEYKNLEYLKAKLERTSISLRTTYEKISALSTDYVDGYLDINDAITSETENTYCEEDIKHLTLESLLKLDKIQENQIRTLKAQLMGVYSAHLETLRFNSALQNHNEKCLHLLFLNAETIMDDKSLIQLQTPKDYSSERFINIERKINSIKIENFHLKKKLLEAHSIIDLQHNLITRVDERGDDGELKNKACREIESLRKLLFQNDTVSLGGLSTAIYEKLADLEVAFRKE